MKSEQGKSRIPRATSLTHQHLLACVASELRDRKDAFIVDVGCGNGQLVRYLRSAFPILNPHVAVTVTGFDVSDRTPHGNDKLESGTPTVRIGEPWPYSDHSVDIIISNQVLEHVFDLNFFFAEVARCLKRGGASIHIFPLKQVLYEDHVGIPLAHKIRGESWIRLMAQSGFFNITKARAIGASNRSEFPRRAIEYLRLYTNYSGRRQLADVTARHGLSMSFDYTSMLYVAKARDFLRRPPIYNYRKRRVFEALFTHAAAYVSGITLVLRPVSSISKA
jgi:SAM-dependent methyltransferase